MGRPKGAKNKSRNEATRAFCVTMPMSDIKQLDAYATEHGLSVSKLVRMSVAEYMANNKATYQGSNI